MQHHLFFHYWFFLRSCFHGNYDINQSHLMLNFAEELYMRPYMVRQKDVSGIKHFYWAIN